MDPASEEIRTRWVIVFLAMGVPFVYALYLPKTKRSLFFRDTLPVAVLAFFCFALQLLFDLFNSETGVCKPWLTYCPGSLVSLMCIAFVLGIALKAGVRSRESR